MKAVVNGQQNVTEELMRVEQMVEIGASVILTGETSMRAKEKKMNKIRNWMSPLLFLS
jgi:demethoxyubiquinone hydroxylase (CLK1/Coq7/Cat5 family)